MPTPSTARWPKPRSEDEFEEIVVDFLRLRWGDPNAQRFGRRGQRQHGVDVIGRPSRLGGASAAGQAKNVASLSVSDVVAEVRKAARFPGGLAEFCVVTSCDRDASLLAAVRQRFAKNRMAFAIEVVFWEDIVSEICVDERLVAKHWSGFGSADGRTLAPQLQAKVGRTEVRLVEAAEEHRQFTIAAHRMQQLSALRGVYADLIAQATQLSIFIQSEIHVFAFSPRNKLRDAFYEQAVVLEDDLYPTVSRISFLDTDENRRFDIDQLCAAFRDVCAEGQFHDRVLSEEDQDHWSTLISSAVGQFCREIRKSLDAEEARVSMSPPSLAAPT